MGKKKWVICLVIILAIGAGLFRLVDFSESNQDSSLKKTGQGQLEARVRIRCGRGGRCMG